MGGKRTRRLIAIGETSAPIFPFKFSFIYINLKTRRILKIHSVTCSSLDSDSCSSTVVFFGDVTLGEDVIVRYSFTPFSVIGTHISSIFTRRMFWFSLDAA